MITNTNSTKVEKGIHVFEVASKPVQVPAGKFQKWSFEFIVDGRDESVFKLSFFDNQIKELLRAIACEEVDPGVFNWEPEGVIGMRFQAELFFEPDRKGRVNEETGEIYSYRNLRGFTPFEESMLPQHEAPWEE